MWTTTSGSPDIASALVVELVVIGEWTTARPEDQRPAADAALAAWHDVAQPPGLLAHHCLLGEDGHSLLHYQQWTSPDSCRAFVGTDRQRWLQSVDSAVPGIHHHRATTYHIYRSTTPLAEAPPTGCLATITVDFDSPDPQRQRDWIDSVFAAAGTNQPSPTAGLIAAHFHVSLDGTRVLNLAEWTTTQAHRDAAATPAPHLRTTTQHFPGVASIAVHRFAPYRGVTPVSPGNDPNRYGLN
jgi:hypothetical protein